MQDKDELAEMLPPLPGEVRGARGASGGVVRLDFQQAPPTPLLMLSKAIEQGASIEVLERLMNLSERHEANIARNAFNAALTRAKGEIPVILKNRTVDFTSQKGRTHYKYEDLAEIERTARPILSKYGLDYRFETKMDGSNIIVTCVVFHEAGHSVENSLPGPRDESGSKNYLQSMGSTLTYLQRMTLKASLGLSSSEDDDAKASGTADDPVITDEQLGTLTDLLAVTSANQEAFLKHFKAESVSKLKASDFDEALKMLKQKQAKKP
jgi:hypothetical protein